MPEELRHTFITYLTCHSLHISLLASTYLAFTMAPPAVTTRKPCDIPVTTSSKSRKSLPGDHGVTPVKRRTKYSRAEVQSFATIFQSIDKDKSGSVSVLELTQAFSSKDGNGVNVANKACDSGSLQMFRVLDRSNNGHISFEDFLRTYYNLATPAELATMLAWVAPPEEAAPAKPPLPEETLQELKDLFKLYDRNGDNRLQRQELAVAASACGYNVDELDALFSNADTDNSGSLSLEEFVEMMRDSFV